MKLVMFSYKSNCIHVFFFWSELSYIDEKLSCIAVNCNKLLFFFFAFISIIEQKTLSKWSILDILENPVGLKKNPVDLWQKKKLDCIPSIITLHCVRTKWSSICKLTFINDWFQEWCMFSTSTVATTQHNWTNLNVQCEGSFTILNTNRCNSSKSDVEGTAIYWILIDYPNILD